MEFELDKGKVLPVKGTFPDKAFDELEAYCFGKQERQKQVNDALNIKSLKVGDN